MNDVYPHQHLDPHLTTWHITFGTYGTRLHGSERPTVDKQHNNFGEAFVSTSSQRVDYERNKLRFAPVLLAADQRKFAESQLPDICKRGGWGYRICSAATDHIHLLCDVKSEIHGEKVRRLVKRWLGQALSEHWPLLEKATWWSEEGSNIAIHDEKYLNNSFRYIAKQRSTLQQITVRVETTRLAQPASRAVPAPILYHFHVNLFASPYSCTWENAAEKLEAFERMIFEPDGSWIWSGEADGEQWHVNGHLFDFSGVLHRVELRGWCPVDQFDRLLTCFGWPDTALTFEMVREGLQLTETEFRTAMQSPTKTA